VTTITQQKTINVRNDFLAREALTIYDGGTNTFIALLGAGDVTARLSTLPTGFDVTGNPSTITGLGPSAMVESTGVRGTYYYAFNAAALKTGLATLVGTTVYLVVEGVYANDANALVVVQPLLVVDPRAPQPA
jgi:hypothetical protein